MQISNLTEFLTSSVLVTGGLLVSTQLCSVEGVSIETNASIRDPNAGMHVCNLPGLDICLIYILFHMCLLY